MCIRSGSDMRRGSHFPMWYGLTHGLRTWLDLGLLDPVANDPCRRSADCSIASILSQLLDTMSLLWPWGGSHEAAKISRRSRWRGGFVGALRTRSAGDEDTLD